MEDPVEVLRSSLPSSGKLARYVAALARGERVRWRDLYVATSPGLRPKLTELVKKGVLIREGDRVRINLGGTGEIRRIRVDGRSIPLPLVRTGAGGGWLVLRGDMPGVAILAYKVLRSIQEEPEDLNVVMVVDQAKILPWIPFFRHVFKGLSMAVSGRIPSRPEDLEDAVIFKLDGLPVQVVNTFSPRSDLIMVEWMDQEGRVHGRETKDSIPFARARGGWKCLIDGAVSTPDRPGCPHAEALLADALGQPSPDQEDYGVPEAGDGEVEAEERIIRIRLVPRMPGVPGSLQISVLSVSKLDDDVYRVVTGRGTGVVEVSEGRPYCLTCGSYSCPHVIGLRRWLDENRISGG